MIEKWFFEKFELIADAPDAVAKMRELVLTQAVQGKLVPQDPSDEPAEEMVRRTRPLPRPARYDKRSNANIQGIAALSVGPTQCDIPTGWACVPLIQIAQLESGHTPSRSRPEWWGGDVCWVGVVDARRHNGKTIYETIQHTNEEGLANSAARMLPASTVCVSRTASVGYVTILGKPMATSQDFVNWVPTSAVTSEWLRLVFTAEKGAFNRFSKGAVHQTIYYPEWISMHTMLPPLAEQKRIVAKVDELMALCDELEAQQQERETRKSALVRASLARFAEAPTRANLGFLFHKSYYIPPAELRKSILTLSVQGKLVPQDPSDEPAEELLRRADSERERLMKSKKIRRQEFLGPVADDSIPFDIPASWQWRYLADVCFLITDGAHHTPQYLESGRPFLSVKDVSSGTIDYSSTRYISEEAHQDLCKRCKPERGDILLTKVGTTGIAVTVDDDREFSIFVSLALLKFSQSNLDGRYLKHMINSPFVKQQSADNTQGIGNKNLVLRLINHFTVPIPPLAEQRRIVAKVEQLIALVDELECQLDSSRTTASKLLDAIVHELTNRN